MFSKRLTILAAALGAAAVAAPAAQAAPVVTEATGPNAAAIQAQVTAYADSLGANNAVGPAAASGRREINWDGNPDDRSAPAFMPEGQFRGRGAVFTTPGLGVMVSGDNNVPADADPDEVEFTNLNANYDDAFGTFSPQRLFSPVGSNVTNVEFVVPASDTPAQTSGFGAVFTDVDVAGATTIELIGVERRQPRRLPRTRHRRQRAAVLPRHQARPRRRRGEGEGHHRQRGPGRRPRPEPR